MPKCRPSPLDPPGTRGVPVPDNNPIWTVEVAVQAGATVVEKRGLQRLQRSASILEVTKLRDCCLLVGLPQISD